MTENTSLDDIINGAHSAALEQNHQEFGQQEESQQAEQPPAQTESTQGEAEPQQQATQDEPPASEDQGQQQQQQAPMSDREKAFLASVQDERSKRQELEKGYKSLEEKFQTLQQQIQNSQQQTQQQQEPENQLDPLLDTEEYLQAKLTEMQQSFQNQTFETRCAMSQEMMKQIHQDYDEVEAVFIKAAEQNPALFVQLQQQANPAKFAYEQGKSLKFQQEVGNDPEAYKNKLKQELLEELKNEQAKANQANASAQRPTSLADTPNAGKQRNPGWQGPTPLEDIIP